MHSPCCPHMYILVQKKEGSHLRQIKMYPYGQPQEFMLSTFKVVCTSICQQEAVLCSFCHGWGLSGAWPLSEKLKITSPPPLAYLSFFWKPLWTDRVVCNITNRTWAWIPLLYVLDGRTLFVRGSINDWPCLSFSLSFLLSICRPAGLASDCWRMFPSFLRLLYSKHLHMRLSGKNDE